MAMALMIQELAAANFSSGAADAGEVLTADGSGGARWAAVPELVSKVANGACVVEGAGTDAVNGEYPLAGIQNGKPSWTRIVSSGMLATQYVVAWSGTAWEITNAGFGGAGVVFYRSSDDVAMPGQAAGWTVVDGVLPLPLVSTMDTPVPDNHVLVADGNGSVAWRDTGVPLPREPEDVGKVLTAGSGGEFGWGDVQSDIPDFADASVDQVLAVTKRLFPFPVNTLAWVDVPPQRLLPMINAVGSVEMPPTRTSITAAFTSAKGKAPETDEMFAFLDVHAGALMLAIYGDPVRAVALGAVYS